VLRSDGRLTGVDVARAIALFGMAATHIYPAFTADGSLQLGHALASGRAAALFAVLAGVGLALASGGRNPVSGVRAGLAVRAGVVARAGLLLVVGLLLAQVDSPPLVILPYYAMLFLLALPVLTLPARTLFWLAATAAVVTPLLSQLLRAGRPPAEVAEPALAGLPQTLFLTGTYPALTWTAYLFIGLAVGRTDLRARAVQVRLVVGGVVLALAAKVASGVALAAAGGQDALARTVPSQFAGRTVDQVLDSGLFGVTPTGDARWLLVSAPHSGATFDLLHTAGTSVAVLGACLLLVSVVPRLAVLPLAAVGSMTLTLYSAHVLALRRSGPLLLDDPGRLYLAHVLVALVVASVWRTRVGRGPLEALSAWLDRTTRAAVDAPVRGRKSTLAPGGRSSGSANG
jgi:hypothetical protein